MKYKGDDVFVDGAYVTVPKGSKTGGIGNQTKNQDLPEFSIVEIG